MSHFIDIANHFQLDSGAVSAESHGDGHINDTFLLKTENGGNYILQRINTSVFKNAEALMNNVIQVTDFLKKRIAEAGGDPLRETLNVIRTKEGDALYREGENYWRVYIFISDTITLQTCENREQFQASASAFGHFQKLLADFPADTLYEKSRHIVPVSGFLTDYLNGDTYFKIHRQGQNLDRCRTQFKLVSDMEKAKAEMDRIVEKYC